MATLAIQGGAYPTNASITLSADRLSVAFGSGLNADCVNRVGPYASADFAGAACYKRGVRANVGIRQGEFRYYEGRRLIAPANFGFGYTTSSSNINPYCCLVDPGQPLSAQTPPSMSLNTLGGIFVQLRNTGGYDVNATSYYGFAVDYTGANPVVYVVTMSGSGMAISRQVTTGFNGADVVPFTYGHTGLGASETSPVASFNFGQQAFHYNMATLQSELSLYGANVTLLVPGVGVRP
ncbi:MAG: hypothetical protein V4739_17155 [Pseudomonadota bacterium]